MDKKTQTYLAIGGVALAAYLATRKQQPAAKGGGGEELDEGDGIKPEIYGCTDILATNYDATASTDDGTCVYDYPTIPAEEVWLAPDAVCGGVACSEYSQLAPLSWYILQALSYDVSAIQNPCESFQTLFSLEYGPTGETFIGSGWGLEILSEFDPSATNLSAEYVESLIYNEFWKAEGYNPQVYDPATGLPMSDFIPFPSDCSIDPTLYMYTWSDLRNHWIAWAAASGETLGQANDPCTWAGLLATSALQSVDLSNGEMLVSFMSQQLMISIGMPAEFQDPFNADGTYKYPFSTIAGGDSILMSTYPQCYNSL